MARNFYIEQDEDIPSVAFELEQPDGFVLLTNIDKLKELINSQYLQREEDGKDYFNDVRVDLVSKYSSGSISLTDIFFIESKIEPVTLKIILGDWMTASYVLTNTVVEGAFTQEFKDELLNYINTYIENNY